MRAMVPSVISSIVLLVADVVLVACGTCAAIAAMRDGIAAMPPCAAHVSLRFDRQGGAFDNLSQSGVLLILRNVGSAECRMPGLPPLRFADGAGHDLAVVREPPPGMHPGPVIAPIGLAPGAEAIAALHWVSRDAFGGHHCVVPARVAIGEGPDAPTATWRSGPLCGPGGKPIVFRQPVLRTGPVAAP